MQRFSAWMALGAALAALLAGDARAQEPTGGPAEFWQRELATHRALGGTSLARGVGRSSLGARRDLELAPKAPVTAMPSPPAKPFEARLTALRTKIQATEARLLFSTVSEARALEYNATRRSELRTLDGDLARRDAEREELLRELSAEYRALKLVVERERWMQSHRPLVLRELSALVEARRTRASLVGHLSEIDATDERLRRLIEKKSGEQRRYGTERESTIVDESLRIELPVAVQREAEPELSADELRLLQELFPAR
ncbi:MAG: hypothetical protein IPN34_09970 [Planctomycetes bacterium]|nr:hypothetical protein [Planctomycetota bacterium]